MTFQLLLSGPDQHKVTLSKQISRDLQTYQKNAIRSIYNSYVTGQPGAILSIDYDINHEHVCAVSINAIYKKAQQNLPSIIMCNDNDFMKWFYFMKKYAELEVFKLTESNARRLLSRNEAVILIVTEQEHAVLRNYVKDYQFLTLVVDQVDLMCTKLIIKQIQADYHLGITRRNFIASPNQELQWKIINWALKKSNKQFLKLNDFIQYDDAYLQIYVHPYASFWYAMTWDVCSPDKKREILEGKAELLKNVKRCAEAHGFFKSERTQPKRRPANERNSTGNVSRKIRKRRIIAEQVPESWTSDEDNLPDLSVFDVSTAAPPVTADSPKKLRLKSPHKKRTIDVFNSSFVDVPREIKTKKLNFDASSEDEEASPTKTFNKANSASIVVDEAVINEFSKPFIGPSTSGRRKLQATQSDSALIPGLNNNWRMNSSESHELHDLDIIQEFSRTFGEPKSANPTTTTETLSSLLTSKIITNAHCSDASPARRLSEDEAESLRLCLSDSSNDENFISVVSQMKVQVAPSLTTAPVMTNANNDNDNEITPDDDIDNCMLKLLEKLSGEQKPGAIDKPAHEKITFSEEREVELCRRLLSEDSDGDNFLGDVIQRSNYACSHENAIVMSGDSHEDNFLTSYL